MISRCCTVPVRLRPALAGMARWIHRMRHRRYLHMDQLADLSRSD